MIMLDERPAGRQILESAIREARLNHLSARAGDATTDAERAHLLTQQTLPARVDYAQRRADRAVLGSLAPLLGLQTLALPVMAEAVDEPPGTPDADGDISTLGLFPGGVDFTAALLQRPDANPDGLPAERWWLHTWGATAHFPAAPETGRLYVQFSVDVDFMCLVPGADIRGVVAFVTLRSGDFFEINWPLQIAQFTAVEQSARTALTTSLPVTAGQQVDLELTYGMLLFAGNGEFESQGSFAAHRTVPGLPAPGDAGLVEYRFVPQWWIDDVYRVTGPLLAHP